jgi:hypothetical protein
VDEALELRPDIVVLALSNFDIQFLDPSPVPDLNSPPRAESPLTFWGKFLLGLKENKATLAATYLLMKYNPEFSRLRVQTYVKRGGSSEYLWTPLPGPWEARVQALDVIIGMIEDRCRKANVPFVLVELPTFQQDFLLKSRDLAPGVDPYQLSGRLNKIAVKHEVQFISTLNAFKEGPDPNDVFYAVDGHMNAEGHSMVAGVLVKELQATLSSGPTPGLEVGDRPRRTLGYEQ